MKLLIKISFAFLMLLSISSVYGASIKGKITDVTSGEALIGANVIVVNMSTGAAADVEGGYNIPNLPVGAYTVKFSYIGYTDVTKTVTITNPDQVVVLNVEMKMGTILSNEVVVSAQAVGQLSAINQQLSADAMMNIVDGTRIRELPDQNVAEAIGRLPGITVTRNDGEGSGIGIRGLAPQYNQVQIDGVVMGSAPDMGRAKDFGNSQSRGVSLQSVSQENLDGIEVFKAILPDMDAATLGGTINLRLGRAPVENQYEAKVQGAYNSYQKDWNNYTMSARASQRFVDGIFGVQLSLDAESRNRGNDRLGGDITAEDVYQPDSSIITQYRTGNGTSIRNLRVNRMKQGANAIFDFASGGTEILFSNFFNRGSMISKEFRRTLTNLYGSSTESKTYSISNSLRGTHKISDLAGLEIEWQLAHYKNETQTPDDYEINWAMKGYNADSLNKANKITLLPEDYIELIPNDGRYEFNETIKQLSNTKETKYVAKLDLKYPFLIANVSGFFKTGFLYKQNNRSNSLQERRLWAGRFSPQPGNPNNTVGPIWSEYPTDYNPDPVLNGKVSIRQFFNVDLIKNVWTDWLGDDYAPSAYDPLKTPNENYDIKENYYAGYFMMKLSALDNMLTLIPGVRYEGDDFDASGYYKYVQNRSTLIVSGIYEAQQEKREHSFWLPMVHLKVRPVEWFDTRLAITKTISRPNFMWLVPYLTADFENGVKVESGNPNLKTTESWNYDLSLSVYDSKFGLLTVSGFYKEITNFSYKVKYFIQDSTGAVSHGLEPIGPAFAAGHYFTRDLEVPTNTFGLSTVKGFEIDYQANLLLLPGFLKNITFSINYTRIFSKSWLKQYGIAKVERIVISEPPWVIENKTYLPVYREGRLPTQPDHILNVSLGYDIGGFSGKVSAFYQGRSLSGVGDVESRDTYIEDFLRFDMSLRYRINDHLSILVTGENLTSTPESTTLMGTSKHSSYSVYGAMYDFGVQVNF